MFLMILYNILFNILGLNCSNKGRNLNNVPMFGREKARRFLERICFRRVIFCFTELSPFHIGAIVHYAIVVFR